MFWYALRFFTIGKNGLKYVCIKFYVKYEIKCTRTLEVYLKAYKKKKKTDEYYFGNTKQLWLDYCKNNFFEMNKSSYYIQNKLQWI